METVARKESQLAGSLILDAPTAAPPIVDAPRAAIRDARLRPYFGMIGETWGRSWCLCWTRRALDFVTAAFTLLVLGLPFLIIALLIKLDSPGPVFFRQARTGLAGRRFRIYKFRTMRQDAEQLKESLRSLSRHGLESPDFKICDDPRITRIGRFLRRTSIDELPNLINVFQGDMSIIGPRPTSFDVDCYADWHLARLSVLPGITGLWQIGGRSEVDFNDRVKLDCCFIREQSPWQDCRILLLTPIRIFDGRGAC